MNVDNSNGMMMMGSCSDHNSFCQGPGRVMLPGFMFSFSPADHPMVENSNCIIWLFNNAVLDTAAKYTFAVLGTFAMCIFLEILRAQRVFLMAQTGRFAFLKPKPVIVTDLCNTLSYIVQVAIAYWVMLLVMLYEGMFFIAIILGLGAGYFISLRMKRAAQMSDDADTKITHSEAAANEAVDQTCQCTSPCCENS